MCMSDSAREICLLEKLSPGVPLPDRGNPAVLDASNQS
jgi:hypothetical protein